VNIEATAGTETTAAARFEIIAGPFLERSPRIFAGWQVGMGERRRKILPPRLPPDGFKYVGMWQDDRFGFESLTGW
jgi:hypothetical protein